LGHGGRIASLAAFGGRLIALAADALHHARELAAFALVELAVAIDVKRREHALTKTRLTVAGRRVGRLGLGDARHDEQGPAG
jgi:hypothetical protein